jgi:hypothetical protein
LFATLRLKAEAIHQEKEAALSDSLFQKTTFYKSLFVAMASAIAVTATATGRSLFLSKDRFPRKLDLVSFFADALDHDLLSFLELVTNVFDAAIEISEMWQQPSRPGMISTNAPKSTIRETVPRYVSPISASQSEP